MKRFSKHIIGLVAFLSPLVANSAVMYAGYTFEDNAFADSVVSYSPGTDVGAGWNDPTAALGQPDWPGGSAVSLGDGGSLVVEFTDNSLTTSGDATEDLFIFEIGNAVEYFIVSISQDALNWIEVGSVRGQPTALDIDSVAGVTPFAKYSFVRLQDDARFNQTGSPYGEADIDAIAAISSAPPVSVNEPATLALLGMGLGLLGFRRRVVR